MSSKLLFTFLLDKRIRKLSFLVLFIRQNMSKILNAQLSPTIQMPCPQLLKLSVNNIHLHEIHIPLVTIYLNIFMCSSKVQCNVYPHTIKYAKTRQEKESRERNGARCCFSFMQQSDVSVCSGSHRSRRFGHCKLNPLKSDPQ